MCYQSIVSHVAYLLWQTALSACVVQIQHASNYARGQAAFAGALPSETEDKDVDVAAMPLAAAPPSLAPWNGHEQEINTDLSFFWAEMQYRLHVCHMGMSAAFVGLVLHPSTECAFWLWHGITNHHQHNVYVLAQPRGGRRQCRDRHNGTWVRPVTYFREELGLPLDLLDDRTWYLSIIQATGLRHNAVGIWCSACMYRGKRFLILAVKVAKQIRACSAQIKIVI